MPLREKPILTTCLVAFLSGKVSNKFSIKPCGRPNVLGYATGGGVLLADY
jgi:hypothetical protein